MKVAIIGNSSPYRLEDCIRAGFEACGIKASIYDTQKAMNSTLPFGQLGQRIWTHLKLETQLAKANRELVIEITKNRPEIVLAVGAEDYSVGALAQIKANLPQVKLLLYWPDPLLRLNNEVRDALGLFDCVYTFSASQVDPLKRLGARTSKYLPFAYDSRIGASDYKMTDYPYDVVFVGSPRPERLDLVNQLAASGIRVGLWGPVSWRSVRWGRASKAKIAIHGPAFGEIYGYAVSQGLTTLNVVDSTTPGASNMRSFEVMGLGGVLLQQAGSEMESEFIHGHHCFYYDTLEGIVSIVESLRKDTCLRAAVATRAKSLVLGSHSYKHRCLALVNI